MVYPKVLLNFFKKLRFQKAEPLALVATSETLLPWKSIFESEFCRKAKEKTFCEKKGFLGRDAPTGGKDSYIELILLLNDELSLELRVESWELR